MRFLGTGLAAIAGTFVSAVPPLAAGLGHPEPDQITMQQAASPIADEMHFFHNDILVPIIVAIVLFVLALLAYAMFRFNERANPVPSRNTHNTLLEVAWAVVPVVILIFIAVPSFRLLGRQLILPHADITIKATGNQWYWTYTYPKDQGGGFSFDSRIKADSDLKPGDIRLLAVDNEAVLPVGKTVLVQVTADPGGVIHSFTIPSLGMRIDAVPGRLNQTWFRAEREGMYYGQCSKLCGLNHAFMPIAFRIVGEEEYAKWLADAKAKFASTEEPAVADAGNAAALPARQ